MARYIDADKIPYYLDTSEEAPMEGRQIAFKSDIEKIPTADVAPRSEVGEPLEDLLVEFDEFGMQPTILVPDPEDRAIRWKRELEYAIGRIKADMAREICCKIEEEIVAALESNYRARKEHIERYADLAYDTELLLEIKGKINALRGIEGFVEELKEKYTEAEK